MFISATNNIKIEKNKKSIRTELKKNRERVKNEKKNGKKKEKNKGDNAMNVKTVYLVSCLQSEEKPYVLHVVDVQLFLSRKM